MEETLPYLEMVQILPLAVVSWEPNGRLRNISVSVLPPVKQGDNIYLLRIW